MTAAEKLFHEIAEQLPEGKEGKMFGALCIKAPNGKAVAMFKEDQMIFKLDAPDEQAAMKLKGAKVFDPRGGYPMKGWTQLSFEHSKKWKELAGKAMDYVKALDK